MYSRFLANFNTTYGNSTSELKHGGSNSGYHFVQARNNYI